MVLLGVGVWWGRRGRGVGFSFCGVFARRVWEKVLGECSEGLGEGPGRVFRPQVIKRFLDDCVSLLIMCVVVGVVAVGQGRSPVLMGDHCGADGPGGAGDMACFFLPGTSRKRRFYEEYYLINRFLFKFINKNRKNIIFLFLFLNNKYL